MRRTSIILAATVAAPLALGGCGNASDNEGNTAGDTGGDDDGGPGEGPGGPGDDGDPDAGPGPGDDDGDDGDDDTVDETGGPPEGCADPTDPDAPKQPISGDLDGGADWTCDTIWVLTDQVFVRGGALNIDPGTTIMGQGGSALIIEKDATINAVGTPQGPIVFTSFQPEGERNRGDWGGLVMLGTAPVNLDGGVGSAEGFATAPTYGGNNASHDCGTLQYVRVEWAGFELSPGNELNGITFYSCGTDTTVDHVQVHMGSDDGFEMFGGEFDAKYLVVTGAADDSLDIDQGWRGNIQHVFIHQDPTIGNHCLEWSNQSLNYTATPQTHPVVANLTCVGSGAGGDKSIGINVKEGTGASIHSSIFANITNQAVVLTHQDTVNSAEAGNIVITGTILDGHTGFSIADDLSWTVADLEAFVLGGTGVVDGPSGLPSMQFGNANIVPAPGSPADGAGDTPSDAFFDATDYAGAVEPGGEDWTKASWINYAL